MKHTVIDFSNMLETVTKDGRSHEYPIDEMQVYENYIHFKRNYVNHPYHEFIEYHLFPQENIGIYVLTQYQNIDADKSKLYKYYVDMVSVKKEDHRWISKDLYLDFIIMCDGKYYVVDVDEFNDAIAAGQLDPKDVTAGLAGLNHVLKGYYKSFDMNEFIHSLIIKYTKENIIWEKSRRRNNYGT